MASSADTGRALHGRVALVAGASGGIGAAIAEALAAAGASLWLVARNRQRLEALAAGIGGGAPARATVADLARHDQVEDLRRQLEDTGTPDILVNAAGGFELAPIAETDPAMFDRMIDGNLRGAFHLIRTFLPGMLDRGSGDIVTIGSIAGRRAFPENGAYSASKFGVRGLHAVLDEELGGTGVRATLVEPAATDTPLWDPLDPDRNPALPPRSAMQSATAVADAVLYVLTRPRDVRFPVLAVQRS